MQAHVLVLYSAHCLSICLSQTQKQDFIVMQGAVFFQIFIRHSTNQLSIIFSVVNIPTSTNFDSMLVSYSHLR